MDVVLSEHFVRSDGSCDGVEKRSKRHAEDEDVSTTNNIDYKDRNDGTDDPYCGNHRSVGKSGGCKANLLEKGWTI